MLGTRREGTFTTNLFLCDVSVADGGHVDLYRPYPTWVGPRAGLDGCGKSRLPTGILSPDLPARSESLYRLSYPGPAEKHAIYFISITPHNFKQIA
jgi:hypothetical protein